MLIEGIEFNEQEINGEFILTANITDVETFKKVHQFVKAHGGSYRKPMSFVFAKKPDFDSQPEEKAEEPVEVIEEEKPAAKEVEVEEPETEVVQTDEAEEVESADDEDADNESEEDDEKETPSDKIIEMPQAKPATGEEKSIAASKKLLEIMQKKQRLLDEMNKRSEAKTESDSKPKSKPKGEAKPQQATSPAKKPPLEDVTQKLKEITAKVEAETAAAKAAAKTSTSVAPKAESKGVTIEVYPPSTIEECEAFFDKLKKDKEWADQQEHKDFMDMIVKSCREDEELRAFVTHKDYYKTWENAGRTYCQKVKNHKHGSTKEQLLPYMIAEYKKPIEKKVTTESNKSTKKK